MKSDHYNNDLKSVMKDDNDMKMNSFGAKNNMKMGDSNIFERNTSANIDINGMNNNGFLPLKGEHQQVQQQEKEKKEEKEEEDVYMSVMRPLQYDETAAFSSYFFR